MSSDNEGKGYMTLFWWFKVFFRHRLVHSCLVTEKVEWRKCAGEVMDVLCMYGGRGEGWRWIVNESVMGNANIDYVWLMSNSWSPTSTKSNPSQSLSSCIICIVSLVWYRVIVYIIHSLFVHCALDILFTMYWEVKCRDGKTMMVYWVDYIVTLFIAG